MANLVASGKVLGTAIQKFRDQIAGLDAGKVTHELGRRTAFQRLLEDTAKPCAGWMFVHEDSIKVKGRLIRPDGLLRDDFGHRRGFWEAKDLADDLDAEIRSKIESGYPTSNIIFENSRRAILYQDGARLGPFALDEPVAIEALLKRFYDHTEKPIEDFKQAVADFGERVPELGLALKKIIDNALATDPKFKTAFATFLQLCRDAINPGLREEAVVEMVIQHLLTERIIRKVFQNADFGHRNVIAHEIEGVIQALTSKSFSRDQFLKSLDPFYQAIEGSFALREEFHEKQTFLNDLYERFFQGFAVKAADTHGIVYTPQEIVDFMVNSVAEVLEREFGKKLGEPGVTILDPCTGTGNFIVNILGKVSPEHLEGAYRERLFANEVMLMPYYIASLNIEQAFAERMGKYEAFEGLCFVDTLDLKEGEHVALAGLFSDANTARVQREYKSSITVVIGNPPYNVGQINENDNNKNRKYRKHSKSDPPGVDDLVSMTYAKDSQATNKNALGDPYVKFFRWATDRLRGKDGIVCFVSNNSFVENLAFDGMRKHLWEDFDRIFHIDLRGNVRQNPKLSGTAYNVFGIQVGVGITLAIRKESTTTKELLFAQLPLDQRRRAKLKVLADAKSANGIEWNLIKAKDKTSKRRSDKRNSDNERRDAIWLVKDGHDGFAELIPIGSKVDKALGHSTGAIFTSFSVGIKTNRDAQVYDFSKSLLEEKIKNFSNFYNYEVYRYAKSSPGQNPDEFSYNDKISWSESLKKAMVRGVEIAPNSSEIIISLYRPFTRIWLFWNPIAIERRYQFHAIYNSPASNVENRVICLTDAGSEKPFMVLLSDRITDLHIVGGGASSQCFPFYTYAEDGTNRRENITDWALAHFQAHYGDPALTKWDIFHYVYAVLHHPEYRSRFAEVLKKELPRIPLLDDFPTFARVGRELARLHVEYESVEPWPDLRWDWTPGVPVSWRVEKMTLSKDKTTLKVNDALTLANIPPETTAYRLGNRSALEWVVDQYQVDRDKTTKAITSDPNRPEDEPYIAKLAARVITVSVRTVQHIAELPRWPEG